MTEKYLLSGDIRPIIPVPHDCIVTNISEDADYLIFTFEDDISTHESIINIHPTAKSLIIRFHKTKYFSEDSELYKYKQYKHHEGYMRKPLKKLFKLTKRRVEYLYHYLAWNAMIIELCSNESVVLKIQTDYVEYDWIEC